ncbi:hypothetical protein J0X19_17170 [Hymenobacter sp. BT186]|uniref:Uncharacterized protein n=1 Tax=Hymenobacter telluris TaxID=2816474 RepID=A0A939JDS3_9BACT|nr:hypothetical protein [Hymenobacter telluris]MBO0359695.1 hypothetical protein [Hymenobacter telluris]MBW3375722.1 hypothetical protein [Hymenobacter norwichensis]
MATQRTFYLRLVFWLLFYAVGLPYAVPACLDWLSRSSNWWLSCGILGFLALAAGVALSLYQAGRALTAYFLHSTSSPSSSNSKWPNIN